MQVWQSQAQCSNTEFFCFLAMEEVHGNFWIYPLSLERCWQKTEENINSGMFPEGRKLKYIFKTGLLCLKDIFVFSSFWNVYLTFTDFCQKEKAI